MKHRLFPWLIALALAAFPVVHAQPAASPADAANPLVWDAGQKDYRARFGEPAANFAFKVENASDRPVEITAIRTSCGCTTVDTPPLPWKLAPGERGGMKVKVDLTDKFGEMTKTIHIISAAGEQKLLVHISIPLPTPPGDQRKRLEQVMLTDRQAIFRRSDCVNCHAQPAAFKLGEPLYRAACAICHGAEHRATMVPDLGIAREHRDAAFWQKWISAGREHSLMPAFAQGQGGPLNQAQIDSLVGYALNAFPSEPAPAQSSPH